MSSYAYNKKKGYLTIWCDKRVKRYNRFSKKNCSPPSYLESVKDEVPLYSIFKDSSIPRIPPPPYESYEDYCKRKAKKG